MKKILFIALSLFVVSAFAASLKDDITSQGNTSYLHKSVSAQQLATSIRDYETVTATNTILYSECGKTFFLNSATEFASTLPAPVAGCFFRFVVKAAPSGASYTVTTSGGSDIIIGGVNETETDTGDDGPYQADADTITLADGVAVVGDYVELVSDGTSWYLSGQTKADGGVSLASS